MIVEKAGQDDINTVSALFDQYRQFYLKEPDIELCTAYISDRIKNGESVIFVAKEDGVGLGFVQLYPTFCSVQASKIYILYDLFVSEFSRKLGVGRALMMAVKKHVKENGGKRIDLRTAKDNKKAQALYQDLGYEIGMKDFLTYSLQL